MIQTAFGQNASLYVEGSGLKYAGERLVHFRQHIIVIMQPCNSVIKAKLESCPPIQSSISRHRPDQYGKSMIRESIMDRPVQMLKILKIRMGCGSADGEVKCSR
jgi:hypothetical protein